MSGRLPDCALADNIHKMSNYKQGAALAFRRGLEVRNPVEYRKKRTQALRDLALAVATAAREEGFGVSEVADGYIFGTRDLPESDTWTPKHKLIGAVQLLAHDDIYIYDGSSPQLRIRCLYDAAEDTVSIVPTALDEADDDDDFEKAEADSAMALPLEAGAVLGNLLVASLKKRAKALAVK